MNIGIILGHQPVESGGAYTFQEDIVNALKNGIENSQHQYYIICTKETGRVYSQTLTNSEKIKLVPKLKQTLLSVFLSKLTREFSLVRKLRKVFKYKNSVEKIAAKYNIKLIWFLSPWAQYIDIPYITIVWDLQHRLQPWFPEVSINGEWDSREDSFGWFLRRASLVIAGTEVGRKEIIDFYQIPSDRIKILPHPTPRFTNQIVQQHLEIKKNTG